MNNMAVANCSVKQAELIATWQKVVALAKRSTIGMVLLRQEKLPEIETYKYDEEPQR